MKRVLLYLALMVQVIGLILLYASHASSAEFPGYWLKTRPVDPRDLLRGDYVILSYDISELPSDLKPGDFPKGRVYVTLAADGKYWKIGAVSAERPKTDAPVLAAEIRGNRLFYDIEKYFVPEGQGNPPLPITVEIIIRDSNRAQIRQFLADGKPWPLK